MLLNGEQPEWVPLFTFGPDPSGQPVATSMVSPEIISKHFFVPGPAIDIWGCQIHSCT